MSSSFADTHNMVAILAKSNASEGFDQMIDFLNVKHLADVTRLQALVNRKKVMISEAVIREVLHLDDAEGVDCLPNEEFFARLSQMGYEKLSTKLTFFKAFFSMVETPLFEGMLAVREIVEEGIAEAQVQDDTAAADVQEDVAEDVQFPMHLLQQALDACAALTRRVDHLKHDKAAQKLEITKQQARVKKLERANKVKTSKFRCLKKVGTSTRIKSSDEMEDVFNQERMIAELDKNEGIELVDEQVKDTAEVEGRQKVQEVVEVVTTAKLITEVVTPATSQVSAASATISAAKPSIPAAALTVVAAYTRKRKRDTAIDHVKQKSKEVQYIKRYQGIKKRPQTESEAHKNMMKAAKRRKLNEEAKEVKDLKKHLEIVPDEDDDVYTEATPLVRKVPVVDYQIVLINNKPRYKIIKADETHQLYISFITMLKNFDREDLVDLWSIVKERFSTSKPNNFSDEYLLSTLKAMFERPDGQDAVWKSQRSVHGQALVKSWKLLTLCGVYIISLITTQFILLAKRRYPLLKFTLEQLVSDMYVDTDQLKECITRYSLANRFFLWFYRSLKEHVIARCGLIPKKLKDISKGKQRKGNKYLIVGRDEHSKCPFRCYGKMMVIETSFQECQIFALNQGETTIEEHYAMIRSYGKEILDSNDGSIVKLGCRLVIPLNGCFLKKPNVGKILATVGRDGNNHIYPIAWAVVDVENKDYWSWFLELLGEDIDMPTGNGLTVISD
nr:pentatricopeptide repeat-containing protein [Tanacetum cinerariifolium]